MNLVNIISLLALFQGIVLGAVMILAHRKDRPTNLLGIFVLTLSLRTIPFFLSRMPYGAEHPAVLFLPLYFWFLSIPMLYLYCRRLAGALDWKKDWIHLLPGILEFGVMSVVYLLEASADVLLFSLRMRRGIIGISTIVAIVPATYYVYLILQFLKRHRNYLLSYYSNLADRDLLWIRNALYAIIGFSLLYTLMVYGPLPAAKKIQVPFGATTNALIIFYVTIHGIRQLSVKLQPVLPDPGPAPDYGEAFRQVEEYIIRSHIYLEPHLTLQDLGKQVHQSERNLSRIINAGSGRNFNSYINHHRILAARRMLEDSRYDQFTMEGIANEAGFNTKATFYQSFKRESGVSPAVYRRQRDTLPDRNE